MPRTCRGSGVRNLNRPNQTTTGRPQQHVDVEEASRAAPASQNDHVVCLFVCLIMDFRTEFEQQKNKNKASRRMLFLDLSQFQNGSKICLLETKGF